MIIKVSPVHVPGVGSKIFLQSFLLQRRINNRFLACWLNQNITKTSFNLRHLFSPAPPRSTKLFLSTKLIISPYLPFQLLGKLKKNFFFHTWTEILSLLYKVLSFPTFICQYEFFLLLFFSFLTSNFFFCFAWQICLQCFCVMHSARSYVILSWINVIAMYFK